MQKTSGSTLGDRSRTWGSTPEIPCFEYSESHEGTHSRLTSTVVIAQGELLCLFCSCSQHNDNGKNCSRFHIFSLWLALTQEKIATIDKVWRLYGTHIPLEYKITHSLYNFLQFKYRVLTWKCSRRKPTHYIAACCMDKHMQKSKAKTKIKTPIQIT